MILWPGEIRTLSLCRAEQAECGFRRFLVPNSNVFDDVTVTFNCYFTFTASQILSGFVIFTTRRPHVSEFPVVFRQPDTFVFSRWYCVVRNFQLFLCLSQEHEILFIWNEEFELLLERFRSRKLYSLRRHTDKLIEVSVLSVRTRVHNNNLGIELKLIQIIIASTLGRKLFLSNSYNPSVFTHIYHTS